MLSSKVVFVDLCTVSVAELKVLTRNRSRLGTEC